MSEKQTATVESSKLLQRPTDFFTEEEIAYLREVSPWRSALSIAHCWAVIVATWIMVSLFPNPLTITLGVMIIGTRQLGLFVLTHDGAHGALFKNRKVNDWVCEWLLNRAFTDEKIDSYRKYHVVHHANTQQENDPDLALSKPFPITKSSFRRKVIRDLTGQTGWDQYGRIVKAAFKGDTLKGKLQRARPSLGTNVLIKLRILNTLSSTGEW